MVMPDEKVITAKVANDFHRTSSPNTSQIERIAIRVKKTIETMKTAYAILYTDLSIFKEVNYFKVNTNRRFVKHPHTSVDDRRD